MMKFTQWGKVVQIFIRGRLVLWHPWTWPATLPVSRNHFDYINANRMFVCVCVCVCVRVQKREKAKGSEWVRNIQSSSAHYLLPWQRS